MALIPSVPWALFKKLTPFQLRHLQSCEIVDEEGEFVFSFINPQTDYVRVQTEYLGQLSNSVSGKTFEEVTNPSEES